MLHHVLAHVLAQESLTLVTRFCISDAQYITVGEFQPFG